MVEEGLCGDLKTSKDLDNVLCPEDGCTFHDCCKKRIGSVTCATFDLCHAECPLGKTCVHRGDHSCESNVCSFDECCAVKDVEVHKRRRRRAATTVN